MEIIKVGKKGDVFARMTRGIFFWFDLDVEVKEKEVEKVSDVKKDEIVDKVNLIVFFLCDINFEFKRGELIIVVGVVGAGKMVFIFVFFGEMSVRDGVSVIIDVMVFYVV